MSSLSMELDDEEAVLLNETYTQTSIERSSRSMVPGVIVTALALFSTVLFANKSTVVKSFGGSMDLSSVEHKLITTRVGYEPVATHTLHVYSLEHVVEPDTTTILKITTCENCGDIKWSIKPVGERGHVTFDASVTDSTLSATFTEANAAFNIRAHMNGQLIIDEIAMCKYVRREIKTVNAQDLNRFFVALKEMYTITHEAGVEKYGKNYLSYQHLTGLHDTNEFTYHGNMFFLTSHPAMQVKFEKSLLSIDPGVALPYWDFLNDAELGSDWTTSEIYSDDNFGAVSTFEKDSYRVPGRFHDVKLVSDVDKLKFPNAFHTPYGYLGSSTMTTASEYLTRSDTYCGFKSIEGHVKCSNMVTCLTTFESEHNLRQLDVCLEEKVHANIHMMHAGQWNCAVDWAGFYAQHQRWLDQRFLSVLAVLMSTTTLSFNAMGDVTCPSSCDSTSTSCACSSSLSGVSTADDLDTLTMAARMSLMTDTWKDLSTLAVGGSDYIKFAKEYDMDGTIYNNVFLPVNVKGEMVNDEPMSNEQVDLLNKLILKTVLFPGDYGIMMTGAAPNDPLFWVMHPIFDKAMHAVRLSPKFNSEGFVWNNIKGDMKWEGMTPFKRLDFEPYLGAGTKTKGEYLKNSELFAILDPSAESTYYIYDQFTSWGQCEYDPFPSSYD